MATTVAFSLCQIINLNLQKDEPTKGSDTSEEEGKLEEDTSPPISSVFSSFTIMEPYGCLVVCIVCLRAGGKASSHIKPI